LTVRDSKCLVSNGETSLGIDQPQSVLRTLKLTLVFAALASTHCLAEDAKNASAGPVATVSMDHNTFIPSEITVAPGTTVTWVNNESMPQQRGGFEQIVPIKDSGEGRQFLFHFYDRGRLQLFVLDSPEHEGQSHSQAGRLT
jgi:hypothetical protein